ncbi:ACP1 [Candida oxycetoniae]|uniref:Acyl carrier protein n=1 Tax=Candida oxycetoniae TaxID=497107 RepID=A0AAI9SVX2_9ASCO|nr:ACP1 [Candida oxycetoniae]KAI3403676.1 ACP1 [Candida oxycetoniae]
MLRNVISRGIRLGQRSFVTTCKATLFRQRTASKLCSFSHQSQPSLSLNFTRLYSGFPALTREEAKERIIELLEGFDKVDFKKVGELTESSSFIQDLGLDSLDVVEVVMELEHEFNIQIPDNEADSIKTYVKGPAYKAISHFGKLNPPLTRSYLPNLVYWGVGIGAAVAVFTEGVPLFQQTFYEKIPFFGQHWIKDVDPEDVPQ